jgi:DNA-3-methyladenine glycosylase
VAQFLPLAPSFYEREDVVAIARSLLGQLLVTRFQRRLTVGRIVETEAYAGTTDKASHAWKGRFTDRTKVMYGPSGHAYVYLCYGLHALFNVVTNRKDIPHAVLIRALEPVQGQEWMALRTGKAMHDRSLTRGPGNLSKAMGITVADSGRSLNEGPILIAAGDRVIGPSDILATPRIGVDYAGADALLPYRFVVGNNPYVSGTNKK